MEKFACLRLWMFYPAVLAKLHPSTVLKNNSDLFPSHILSMHLTDVLDCIL